MHRTDVSHHCWRLSAIVLIMLSLGAPPVTRAVQGPPGTADSLVGVWIDALGGMNMYHDFQSASFTVTTVLYDTLSGREKRSRPRYVWIKKGPHGEETRVERWETGGLIQQGFNGRDQAWAAVEGTLLPDSAKDAREALYVSRDLFYWFGLPFKLRDPGVFLEYRGMSELPGRAWTNAASSTASGRLYHAVGVSFGEGVGEHQDVFVYYFAPGRASPVEVTYVEEGRQNLSRLMWGETVRAKGSLPYPYVARRDWLTLSGKLTKALVISDVVINPDVPQSRFEKP